ncbi:hypothetical protein [Shimia sp.]
MPGDITDDFYQVALMDFTLTVAEVDAATCAGDFRVMHHVAAWGL